MAIQQTVMSMKNLHYSPKMPPLHSDILNLSSSPNSLLPLFSSQKTQLKRRHQLALENGILKCSIDNNNNNNKNVNDGQYYEYERHVVGQGQPQQYPRPLEIEWKKEICNSVQLIGTVGTAVQIKHLTSGKAVAWSRFAVKKSSTDTTWINLTFWDELAHVAFQHVEKGQQIYVSGRLVSDSVEGDDGRQQTYYKVVVSQLNFVQRNVSPVALYDGDPDSTTPGRRPKNYATNSTGSVEELWQAFFANPVEWWDNRKNKRSPNYPDFKHKDTGEALWVEGRYNPPWVKSQLSILDTRMEQFAVKNASTGTNFELGDDFSPF